METMRENLTDDRLDDLNGKVDDLRLEMRAEFKAVRGEMKEEFGAVRGEMKAGFDKIDERFQNMDQRLLEIYRMMFGFCGLMLAALIGLLATQI
jgi:predicted  nucleic acid-binding Zn-ribbon protein